MKHLHPVHKKGKHTVWLYWHIQATGFTPNQQVEDNVLEAPCPTPAETTSRKITTLFGLNVARTGKFVSFTVVSETESLHQTGSFL